MDGKLQGFSRYPVTSIKLMIMSYYVRQEYSSVSRQLCTEPLKRNVTVEHEFFLGVSTSDPKNLSFVASVTPVDNFVVE